MSVWLILHSDLASNDVNGIQMEILRLMPMGRNADRDAKC